MQSDLMNQHQLERLGTFYTMGYFTLVFHPNKPGKIRVVFNCSTEFKGKSINYELMLDTDMTNHREYFCSTEEKWPL